MKSKTIFAILLPLVGTPIIGLNLLQEQNSELNAQQLREMVVGLGYEVKDLSVEAGKEKIQIDVKTEAFNIPLGVEISPSKSYVWLTASLGKDSPERKYRELLMENGKIQPSQFYLTSSNFLMIALPIENRLLTPTIIRNRIDKLAKDVSSRAATWQVGIPPEKD